MTDSSGASAPQVQITAKNEATGTVYTTTSNEAGNYIVPQMVPGVYTIAASKEGFDTIVQSGFRLRTGDRASLNLMLKPGTTRTEVTVTAEAGTMTIDDASNANVLDNKMITELPQLSRSTLDLTKVSPAVQGNGPKQAGNGSDASLGVDGSSYSLAAGQVNGALITVDGANVQDAEFSVVNRAIPTPDVVGEFRVQTGVLTADVGRYSGGVITISTASGTNQLHGRLFEYYRNDKMNSNDWRNNALGVPKFPFHQNNYGMALGGPIVLPKLYNGKDKTFFYGGWEGERYRSSKLATSSVPTALERQGDFSQTIINTQNGQPVYASLFNMFSGYTGAGGNWIRPELPNATIPQSMIVKPMQEYLNLWPMPNHAPDANTSSTNNYYSSQGNPRDTDRLTFRIDHSLSNEHRLNVRVSRSMMTDSLLPPFNHATGETTTDLNWSGSLQYTWVPSATTVFEVRLGASIANLVDALGSSPDPSINTDTWGFDPALLSTGLRASTHIPPQINGTNYTPVGGQFYDKLKQQVYNASLSFTKIMGRHTLKVGYQHFYSQFGEFGGDASGATWVNPGGGSNQTWNNPDGLTGNSLAELMLGSSSFYTWGNWYITPYTHSEAAFAMDDWKVNTKLTVQMGLRWDHDNPRHVKYPNTGVFFDLNAKNVLTPNADWNWSQVTAAVPGLANYPQPAWLTNGVNGRVAQIGSPEYPQKSLYSTDWKNFQPRLGLSYALTPDTILHASAGIIFQGLNGLGTEGASFYYPTVTFSQIPTLDGKNWVSEMGTEHGLGTFPVQPDGARLGYFVPARTNQAFWNLAYGACANPIGICNVFGPHMNSPEEYTWDFTIQRRISKYWILSADYMGIRGIHLITPVEKYKYSNDPTTYYSLGSALRTQVPNPFSGQSQTFSSEPTVPLSQLLSQMPQYSDAGPGLLTEGKSFSNFLNLQAQIRDWHGFTLLGSYAIRKTLTNNAGKDYRHGGPLDQYNAVIQNPESLMEGYGVAIYEYPETLLLNYSYELPFGRTHRLLPSAGAAGKVLDAIAGGWGIAGVTTWQPHGTPVLVPAVSGAVTAPGTAGVRWSVKSGVDYLNPNLDYASAMVLSGQFTQANPQTVFNKDAFVRTPSYSFGNLPFVYPNVRNPGQFLTDATAYKNFYFSENRARYLNFRMEALNFLNHANLGGVITNPDSQTFGGVGVRRGFRTMQLGLRLFF